VEEAAAEATAAEVVAADTAEEVGAALAGAAAAVGMTRTRRLGKARATCQPATGTMRSTSSISTPLRPRRRCKAALLRKGARPVAGVDVVTAQGGKLCSVRAAHKPQ